VQRADRLKTQHSWGMKCRTSLPVHPSLVWFVVMVICIHSRFMKGKRVVGSMILEASSLELTLSVYELPL